MKQSCSYGNNYRKVRVVNGGTTLETYGKRDKWIPKASINVGREFDGADIPKRYSVKFEFFYNGAGYSEKIFNDTTIYLFDKTITIEDGMVIVLLRWGNKFSYMTGK